MDFNTAQYFMYGGKDFNTKNRYHGSINQQEKIKMNNFPQNKSQFTLPGPAGNLEVATTWPTQAPKAIGIICHPLPQFDGTMNNKVVTTIERAFINKGLATLRFNFRGVGKSEGSFANTIGETEDLKAIIQWVKQVLPNTPLWLGGFSFGSYIAAKAANEIAVQQLVSIAPPVNHNDFVALTNIHCPWWLVQGDQDEIVPASEVIAFAKQPPSPLTLKVMAGVGHFFHGHLIELREYLQNVL